MVNELAKSEFNGIGVPGKITVVPTVGAIQGGIGGTGEIVDVSQYKQKPVAINRYAIDFKSTLFIIPSNFFIFLKIPDGLLPPFFISAKITSDSALSDVPMNVSCGGKDA